MPILRNYNIFISHAWRYNEDYYRLEKFLDSAPNFSWRNYSVPEHDPVIDPKSDVGKKYLTTLLDNQIKPSQIVLIISGMYGVYSDWILKEIQISKKYSKPIVGIIPWGQERIPADIQNACDIMVGWNTDSIINAIRTYSL